MTEVKIQTRLHLFGEMPPNDSHGTPHHKFKITGVEVDSEKLNDFTLYSSYLTDLESQKL